MVQHLGNTLLAKQQSPDKELLFFVKNLENQKTAPLVNQKL